jgi:hypothetical protein
MWSSQAGGAKPTTHSQAKEAILAAGRPVSLKFQRAEDTHVDDGACGLAVKETPAETAAEKKERPAVSTLFAGIMALLGTTLLWGFSGPAFKAIDVHPVVRIMWRLQTSLLVAYPLCAVVLIRNRDPVTDSGDQRARLFTWRTLKWLAITGTLSLGVFLGW